MVYVLLFINAIVVALMAMYIYENERRMGEMIAKLDRTGVTVHGETVDKFVELLSNSCGCKQNKEFVNDNEDLSEEKGPCKVKRPSDCMDLDKSTCKSGIYKIYPEKTSGFNVFCEMGEHGGGWTVFQHRMNGKINFYRDWESYKSGFGNMNEEHWLGNENLHQLTSQGKYMLRIDMSDFENNHRHAIYSQFSVGSERAGYRLDVTGYSGDAALMAMYVYENERRMGAMSAKLDRTGNTPTDKTTPGEGVTFHGETAAKIVELLSNRYEWKQEKERNNINEELEEEQGPCKVKRPSDCMDLDKSTCKSGIYKIYPEKTFNGFNVFCTIDEHGRGWTVFQRRMNGIINFYRDWESYKSGFGNMNEEHWLGNEHLHQLTSQGKYMLRIDMSDFENNHRHAVYNKFSVGNETSGYKLDVTGYSGDAGDAMNHQNGHKFSTMDNDKNSCAVRFKGGWWYNECHHSNLNGLYLKGSNTAFGEGINWYQWKGHKYSLKTTTMMIRRI